MITLLRWYLLKAKEIKWKLALWQFIDRQAAELLKDPQTLEKKLVSSLAELIHTSDE